MPELSRRWRMLVLAICCLSLFIFGVDSTIVNVALPSIQRDLHAPVSGLQWTVDAYTVVIASVLILAGSTADRFGRRKVFQIGLATFTLGSLLCSLAPGLGWLVAFRMVQAVGGSMMNPVAVSIIANTFTDPRERARAIGIWGGVFGLAIAAGPPLGGVLVDGVGWRGIFWVNIPIGVAAIVLTALFVPESRAARPRRVDPVGQVLVIVTLASLTYAIIEGPRAGWTSPEIVGLFAVAAAGAAALIAYEPRRREPLLDFRFFRSAPFTGATLIAISALAALGGFLFLNTLYLQEVRDLSPLSAGLCTLPLAAMTVVVSPIAGRVVGTRGVRGPLVVGGLAVSVGSLMLVSLSADTSLAWLLAAYSVFGLGFGAVNPPITNAAVSGMPASQAGVAAAVATTSRQIGLTLGVAVVGAVATAQVGGSLHDQLATASHTAWWLIAALGAGIAVLGLAASTGAARASAERTAARLQEAPQAA